MSYLKHPVSTVDEVRAGLGVDGAAARAHVAQHPLAQRLPAQNFQKSEARPGGDPEPEPDEYSVKRTYINPTNVWKDHFLDNVLEKILFHDTSFVRHSNGASTEWAGPDSVLVIIGDAGLDGQFGAKEIQVATTPEKYAQVDAAIRKMILWELIGDRVEVRAFCEYTVGGTGADYGAKRTEERSGPRQRSAFLYLER